MKYFSYSPDFAFELHDTAEEARTAAQDALDELRADSPDGWSPDVDLICWGEVKQLATMTNKRTAEPESGFEFLCDYELIDSEAKPEGVAS